MSDFNLRLSFGAYFLPTNSYPHVYLNARSLLVLRSIASLYCHYNDHITRIRVSTRYAARWITRCPINPRGCRRWKKFCRFFSVEETLVIMIGGSISAHQGTLWRCRSLMRVFSSYRVRTQVVSAIYIVMSVMVFTRVTKVTRFPCGARLKADIDVSSIDEDRQRVMLVPRIRTHRKLCERKINELILKEWQQQMNKIFAFGYF